jgi:aerobic-type carbon monoxide dehydrogenase small subunit (CoxS/CutS family)
MRVTLQINGKAQRLELPESGVTLLDALRDYAGLTGTKYGCGEGQCGACTVLVDGRAVQSCLVSAASMAGKKIVTIEGLADGERLHVVQEAFLAVSAFQCAFCTPGMILESVALLESQADPTETQIRERLNGHLCRCGTYPRIVEAVRLAASLQRSSKERRRDDD